MQALRNWHTYVRRSLRARISFDLLSSCCIRSQYHTKDKLRRIRKNRRVFSAQERYVYAHWQHRCAEYVMTIPDGTNSGGQQRHMGDGTHSECEDTNIPLRVLAKNVNSRLPLLVTQYCSELCTHNGGSSLDLKNLYCDGHWTHAGQVDAGRSHHISVHAFMLHPCRVQKLPNGTCKMEGCYL